MVENVRVAVSQDPNLGPIWRPADTAPRPHDLLRVDPAAVAGVERPLPDWAVVSLARWPVVVVRRAPGEPGVYTVGIRGDSRAERSAALVPAGAVTALARPEDLAAHRLWEAVAEPLPAMAALDAVAALMAEHALIWGPVGSVGYALATGRTCVTPASDLDLAVQASAPLDRDTVRALAAALAALPVRVDVQIETPSGAVALADLASGAAQVALRTAAGPLLVADPWAVAP